MTWLKKQWKELDRGRRGMVLIQPVLFLLALALALTYGQQWVVSYRSATLRYQAEGDTAVYSGRVDGRSARFSVSSGQTVEYWLDGELYGAYTVVEDPSAVPPVKDAELFTGVEIRRGGEVWFRGAYHPGLVFRVYAEDGGDHTFLATAAQPEPEPVPGDILYIAQGPEVQRRGDWRAVLLGAPLGIACVLLVLFEEQLYRWQMSFRMRRPEQAEPTEWEILSHWTSWIALTGATALLYAVSTGLLRP